MVQSRPLRTWLCCVGRPRLIVQDHVLSSRKLSSSVVDWFVGAASGTEAQRMPAKAGGWSLDDLIGKLLGSILVNDDATKFVCYHEHRAL